MRPHQTLIAEFIGTFALVFFGAGAIVMDAFTDGAVGLVGVALAHAIVLSIVVTATMNISGGHINPAVTVAMLIFRRITPSLAAGYIVAQLLGAVAAALTLRALYPGDAVAAASLGTPALAAGIDVRRGVLIEIVLTFFLGVGIWGTAVHPKAPAVGGFGIGLVLVFDILAGGPLTGAAMNPARAFGPALAGGYWDDQIVYWIGPIIGMALAAAVFELFLGAGRRPLTPEVPEREVEG